MITPTARAGALAIDLARPLADVRAVADDLVRFRGLAEDLAFARDFALLIPGDLAVGSTPILALSRVNALNDVLIRAKARACDLAEVVVRDLTEARACAMAGALADNFARLREVVGGLADDFARSCGHDNDRAQYGARRVAPSAVGLLTAAARLLPVADRSRYAEEYGSELWEIAQAGAGHIAQLRYALRQLCNTFTMSVELRSPRHRSSAP